MIVCKMCRQYRVVLSMVVLGALTADTFRKQSLHPCALNAPRLTSERTYKVLVHTAMFLSNGHPKCARVQIAHVWLLWVNCTAARCQPTMCALD